MKPDFLVIGAAKAGTTSLCSLLGGHPEVHMCPLKETHFFSRRYDRGWKWYERLFDAGAGETMVGEGSPSYTCNVRFPEAPARIAEHLPDVRLIYTVRHPIRRIESQYVQKIANGRKWSSFDEALRQHPALIDASMYWKQINCYRDRYPDEQILVLFLDDLQADPAGVLDRCFEFLGVDSSVKVDAGLAPRNTRAQKQTDGAVLARLRKRRGFLRLKQAIPRWMVEKARPLFGKPVNVDVRWNPDTLQWVEESILADSRKFLDFYNKPLDYWGLDSAAQVIEAEA